MSVSWGAAAEEFVCTMGFLIAWLASVSGNLPPAAGGQSGLAGEAAGWEDRSVAEGPRD